MICFEILINGNSVCRAGADDLQVLTTFVTWARKPSRVSADAEEPNLHINVGGITLEKERPQWLNETLSVGDELSIRIVESYVADQPTMRTSLPNELMADMKGFVEKFKDLGSF